MASSTRLPASVGTHILMLLASFVAISSMDGQQSNAVTADTGLTGIGIVAFAGPTLELDSALNPTDLIAAPDLRTFGIASSDQPPRLLFADPTGGDLENEFAGMETVTPVAEAATWAMAALTVFALFYMQRRRIYQFLSKTVRQARASHESSTVTAAHTS